MPFDPADVPTIAEILDEYGVSDYLEPSVLAELIDALSTRENIMITDGFDYKLRKGYDRIISQV